MGRTACTEPQCLYKGDLYLYLYLVVCTAATSPQEADAKYISVISGAQQYY